MKRRALLCCIACVVLLICGCSQTIFKNVSPAPVVSSGDDLLGYALRFGELSAEAQKKELAQVTQAANRNKNDTTSRMKAALIYGLPASRLRDNERALALLDGLQRDVIHADTDTRALAGLLKEYVAERQRLESNATKVGQKAADEQKRADSEQKRADDLQQKLDELKNIDKAISERYQTRPR